MAKFSICCLSVLVLIVSVGVLKVDSATSRSSKLLDNLLKDYGPPTVRPVKDEATVTTVIMRLLVTQIIDLEEKEQTLTLSGWLKWIWFDENLKWNRRKHPGVNRLLVPIDKIWMPDIVLINNVDEKFESYKIKEVLVYHNGRVEYSTPTILQFTCKINARIFPYDRQVCEMSFMSWNHHMEEMDLLPSNDSDSQQNKFVNDGVWELNKIQIRRFVDQYYFGQQWRQVPTMVYSLYMKRRPLHHVLNILIPCLLLSIVNLMVYLLPPEAGEKIGLGMTNLLALVLFQELVAESLPPSSDNSPIISYYFVPMTILSCFSIINAVLVLKLFYYGRHEHPVPSWMKLILVKCLAPIVCFQHIAYEDEITNAKPQKLNNLALKNKAPDDDKEVNNDKENVGFHIDDEEPKDDATRKSHIATDWQNIALLWDKLMLIVMSLLTFVSLMVVISLYTIEIRENDVVFESNDGMEVEAVSDP